jgi:hypothetical protein
MGIVDITHISKPFFLSTVLFVILILSSLSLAILQLVNKRTRQAILFFAIGVLTSIIYTILIQVWLADTMPKTP